MNQPSGTPKAQLPPVLKPLRARLTAGVAVALGEAITDPSPSALTDPALRDLLAPVDDLWRGNGLTSDKVNMAIAAIATYLLHHRRTLLQIIGQPGQIPAVMAGYTSGSPVDPVRVWLRCCWLVEAAWQATNSTVTPGGADPSTEPFAATDLELLRPAAARQRFLLLSEPMRHPGITVDDPDDPDWRIDGRYGVTGGLAEDVFGTGAAHDVLGRCRQARWNWKRYLDHYQDHPVLATATSRQIEDELTALGFRDHTATQPLLLSWKATRGDAAGTADDRTVSTDLIERHLLPRLRILQVLRLGLRRELQQRTWLPAAAAGTVAGVAVTAVALAITGWFTAAAFTAALSYLLLAAGVVALGPAWGTIWLLRLPAAAALGLAALTTLNPDWWAPTPHWWYSAVVLVAGSYGYLVVEARNHGVPPFAALARAFGVTVVGLIHALLVTLIGIVTVVPKYAEQGKDLLGMFHHAGWPQSAWPGVGRACAILAAGTAWCLAAGVISQILWDDRPITAPLAHLRWRGEQ